MRNYQQDLEVSELASLVKLLWPVRSISVRQAACKPQRSELRLFLLFLPIFYFFNYFGEELLWRGYILPRQEVTQYGKYAWVVNALLHWVFHLSFSFMAILAFLPFLFLIPYVVQQRKSTSLSIIIHFLLGAPTQFLVAIGLLS